MVRIQALFIQLCLAMLLFSTSGLSAAASEAAGEASELRALLDRFLASADDLSMHQRFWDERLVYTSSSGARFGKADILAGMRQSAEEAGPEVRYRAEETHVMNFGTIAVVTFRLVGETEATGDAPAEVSEYFNTGTFQQANGVWRAVAWQATRIPRDP